MKYMRILLLTAAVSAGGLLYAMDAQQQAADFFKLVDQKAAEMTQDLQKERDKSLAVLSKVNQDLTDCRQHVADLKQQLNEEIQNGQQKDQDYRDLQAQFNQKEKSLTDVNNVCEGTKKSLTGALAAVSWWKKSTLVSVLVTLAGAAWEAYKWYEAQGLGTSPSADEKTPAPAA